MNSCYMPESYFGIEPSNHVKTEVFDLLGRRTDENLGLRGLAANAGVCVAGCVAFPNRERA
ncbi:MAG: hypothetical protein HW389_3639 [Bacteroidetes bacterium]|nr:hypothetical protein [Bacteroidota bacterium]